MRTVNGFLLLFFSVFLFLMPMTEGIKDFRTDSQTDSFYTTTAVGITSANNTLHDYVYDNDTSSISVMSNLWTDIPVFASYNITTRQVLVTGLTDNTSRTLEISYLLTPSVFTKSSFWPVFLNNYIYFWWTIIALFGIVGLIYVILGLVGRA